MNYNQKLTIPHELESKLKSNSIIFVEKTQKSNEGEHIIVVLSKPVKEKIIRMNHVVFKRKMETKP